MSEIGLPPALPFVALLHGAADPEECLRELTQQFGPIAATSPMYATAPFSRYYEAEMGTGLQKRFVVFERPMPMERLVECKQAAQALERRFQQAPGKRNFNIDPGLLTRYSVVLATSKNHAHRIYLRDAVFAEVTLIFRHLRFHPLPWTYPDYRTPLALRFFEGTRPGDSGRKAAR
jgi:hypothetical protein